MTFQTILVAILIFGFLIVIHELGHFIFAKLSGVVVEEFAIGMGPKIFGYQGKETKYSLRLIPMGGYCQMLGEDAQDYQRGSFNSKSKLARILILSAGSLMNLLGCIVLLTIIFFIVGVPSTTLDLVEKDFPAYEVGLRQGDTIVAIEGKGVNSWEDVISEISSTEEKTYAIDVLRDGQEIKFSIASKFDEELNQHRIGITSLREKSVLSSITNGFKQTFLYGKLILVSIGQLFTGKVSTDSLTGPIGIVSVVGQSIEYGVVAVLNLAAVISINLAIFNILPIPALDGSRILFVIIEAIKGSPISPEKEGKIHFVGFALLMLVAIFVAYNDILRLR